MSELNSSEALIISGETKKGIFTLDNQKINCIGDNAEIIHTGNNVKIYDNEGNTYYPDKNYTKNTGNGSFFVATGENSFIEASSGSVSFTSGKGAEVYVPYVYSDDDDDDELLLKDAFLIATGDESFAYPGGQNSLGIVTGENSNIFDLGCGSIGISTGNNTAVGSEGPFKKAVILGDNSSIGGRDSTEFTAFSGGLQTYADIGPQSSLLSEFPVKHVSAGTGSVIVTGWHDGTRKRYSVYYEGVDFEAGKKYMTNELGELHPYQKPEN